MPAGTAIDASSPAAGFGRADLGLLKRPLEFLLADHHRQRSLCHLLDGLADAAAPDAAIVDTAIGYIEQDLALHIIDEEEDLFPLLRRRARPEDDVERVLGLLSREHVEDDRLAGLILSGLCRSGLGGGAGTPDDLTSECRAALRAFARRQRRHIAVENAIVMPLAELRLSAKDRAGLARRMAARRGISLCEGGGHG
jgi:hemerythrin-like domain-containing protein